MGPGLSGWEPESQAGFFLLKCSLIFKIMHPVEGTKIILPMPLATLHPQGNKRVDEGGLCLSSGGLQVLLSCRVPFPASWKVS